MNNWAFATSSFFSGCGSNGTTNMQEKLQILHDSGVSVIRIAAYQTFATNHGVRDWSALDQAFANAQAWGMNVIPVLGNNWTDCDFIGAYDPAYNCGSTPSRSCGEPVACGGTGNWYDVGYKEAGDGYPQSFRAWSSAVVSRYGGHPALKAWEILNEPWETCAHAFFADMTSLVRSFDPTSPISLGGNANGWNYSTENALPAVTWATAHDYGKPTVPLPGWIANDMTTAAALGKPFYIGESGIDSCDTQERADQLRAKVEATFANGGIGYLLWAYSQTTPTTACGINFGPGSAVLAMVKQLSLP